MLSETTDSSGPIGLGVVVEKKRPRSQMDARQQGDLGNKRVRGEDEAVGATDPEPGGGDLLILRHATLVASHPRAPS